MPLRNAEPLGVILLSMGGPEKLGDVREFLFNIFSDRAIIQLPGGRLLQKPFARLISKLRCRNVQEHYQLIGGGSPLLKWTQIQAKLLEQRLADMRPGAKSFVGMRYFRPTIEEAIRSAHQAGVKQMILIPMYPHYSMTTTGSSFDEARKWTEALGDVRATYVSDFHDRDFYINLLRDYISVYSDPDDTLLFSAHSIPQRFVDKGDPYVDQVRRTAELAADGREYFVSFQSRTGPVKWVGPDTIEEARRLLSERSGSLFLVPASFVCDHIETLYEIDIELKDLLGDIPARRVKRMPMFNDDPRFADGLTELILKEIGRDAKM
jgi:ferrochelatase